MPIPFFIFANVMAKNYFKSYIWLLETLQSHGPMTLKEIRSLWLKSAVNEKGADLPARTLANHIAAIADIFGIDISCERSYNRYYIENVDELGGSSVREWMIDALCLNSLLNESASLRDRIFFENVPSRHKYLTTIIQAIRDNKKMEIHYQSYRKKEMDKLIVEPYFLKEFKRRWYLYAYKGDADGPHMLALDRMKMVDVLPDDFTLPKEFSAENYFRDIYGVRVYPNMKREEVLLKVYGRQVQYFRSLPLHASQKEVETHDDYSVFSYYLTTDYDFKQDVLSFGDTVEVLELKGLRQQIAETISSLSKYYKNEKVKN